MAGYGGIGGLSQARDLFAAPGSLMGYDPYYQDIQRFQKGGLGTTDPVSYASLTDPYGAERTAAARGRSLDIPITNPFTGRDINIDPVGVAGNVAGSLMNVPIPVAAATGLVTSALGARRDLSDAEKQRTMALPPGMAKPLGLPALLKRLVPEWLGGPTYEDALTDKDMETLQMIGGTGDLGATLGAYNVTDPKGTLYGQRVNLGGTGTYKTTEAGPRTDTTDPVLAQQTYEYNLREVERLKNIGLAARRASTPPWQWGSNVTQAQRGMLDPYTGTYGFPTTGGPAFDAYGRSTAAPEVQDAYYGGGVFGPSFVATGTQTAPDYTGAQARYDAIAAEVAADRDRAAAQEAAKEFAAWDPGGGGGGGGESYGFGAGDDEGLGY